MKGGVFQYIKVATEAKILLIVGQEGNVDAGIGIHFQRVNDVEAIKPYGMLAYWRCERKLQKAHLVVVYIDFAEHFLRHGGEDVARFDKLVDTIRLLRIDVYALFGRVFAVELAENEYFIADLIGLKASSDEGEELGEITDVLQTGANDVYVISKEGTPDLLVPAIRDCVVNVDVAAGTIVLHLLDGLR